jgi:hypothetical protein
MTLQEAIKSACEGTEPRTQARSKALASIKWRLRSPAGLYAGIDGYRTVLTDAQSALVFDGRDNEEMKAQNIGHLLGVPLAVELVSFGV